MAVQTITDRYVDIKGTKLAQSSMLRMMDIFKDEDSVYFMNIFKNFEISETVLENPSNTERITILNPWWENIAYAYYKDVNAWWILCMTNNVLNPFEEIVEGGTLKMLKSDFLPFVQRDMEAIFIL